MYALLPIENTSSYQLHFNYQVEDIQREIEKRTSYLGRFRRTEQTSHLQDLIAMTKDEQNLLIPFAQSAMADVWDQLRKGCLHLSGLDYEWEERKEVREVALNPILEIRDSGNRAENTDSSITIKGGVELKGGGLDNYIYGVELKAKAKVETSFLIKDGKNSQIINHRYVDIHIPHTNVYYDETTNKYTIIPYTVQLNMEPSTEFTSEEVITDVEIVELNAESYNKREGNIDVGEYISIDGQVYCATRQTNVNKSSFMTDIVSVQAMDIRNGIHYRMNVSSKINPNLIAPLDTAIIEALVNKIIYSWLMLAYPQEAEVYATLYVNAASQVYQRCNIFNVTHNKVPRIF
jgi:hypothetical protein